MLTSQMLLGSSGQPDTNTPPDAVWAMSSTRLEVSRGLFRPVSSAAAGIRCFEDWQLDRDLAGRPTLLLCGLEHHRLLLGGVLVPLGRVEFLGPVIANPR